MRGREKFRKAKFLIDGLALLFQFFPKFIKIGLYGFFSNFSGLVFVGVRYALLRSLCESVGNNVYIDKDVCIKNFSNLSIGSNVSIHRFSYVDALGGISIGCDVSIAHNCSLVSFDHDYQVNDLPIRDAKVIKKNIEIGNDVWIGCGVRVLGGASVQGRSVIAAGAVVTKKLPVGGVYAGVPARFVKEC